MTRGGSVTEVVVPTAAGQQGTGRHSGSSVAASSATSEEAGGFTTSSTPLELPRLSGRTVWVVGYVAPVAVAEDRETAQRMCGDTVFAPEIYPMVINERP